MKAVPLTHICCSIMDSNTNSPLFAAMHTFTLIYSIVFLGDRLRHAILSTRMSLALRRSLYICHSLSSLSCFLRVQASFFVWQSSGKEAYSALMDNVRSPMCVVLCA